MKIRIKKYHKVRIAYALKHDRSQPSPLEKRESYSQHARHDISVSHLQTTSSALAHTCDTLSRVGRYMTQTSHQR